MISKETTDVLAVEGQESPHPCLMTPLLIVDSQVEQRRRLVAMDIKDASPESSGTQVST